MEPTGPDPVSDRLGSDPQAQQLGAPDDALLALPRRRDPCIHWLWVRFPFIDNGFRTHGFHTRIVPLPAQSIQDPLVTIW